VARSAANRITIFCYPFGLMCVKFVEVSAVALGDRDEPLIANELDSLGCDAKAASLMLGNHSCGRHRRLLLSSLSFGLKCMCDSNKSCDRLALNCRLTSTYATRGMFMCDVESTVSSH